MGNSFQGGVHPADHKEFSRDAAYTTYLAKGDLVFPLSQHIGAPAKPVVAKGDQVLAGQLIAEAGGFVSANIVSSCSGKVKAIENRRNITGSSVMSIVIENDGQFTLAPGIGEKRDPARMSNQEIIDAVKTAGIIGLGGAGFPTHVKLMPKDPDAIKYVIANGAECEPYITCDDQLMRTKPNEIAKGMELILRLFKNAEGIILMEDNKPEAAAAMTEAVKGRPGLRVLVVPTKYPQGGERSIIKVVAGEDLKLGMLPADVGCVVDNVATIYAIYRAVCFNEPLMEKGVSVTGDAITTPSNMMVRIGTSCQELVDAAGGFKDGIAPKKILSGGPMMGFAIASLDAPLQKANNAITLLKEDEVELAEKYATACLRCGRCNKACPLGLVPQMMADAALKKDYDRYEKKFYGLECIACGSCTFTCPAKRPLMQIFKLTKAEIMAIKKAQRG